MKPSPIFVFFEPTSRAVWSAILLVAFFSASLLSAQVKEPVRSIRVHGEMKAGERSLNLVQIVKSQNQIRSSIIAADGVSKVTMFFANDAITLEENLAGERTIRRLSGADAAAYLLDLLALNPEYHFPSKGGFDLQHPIFDGYSVRVQRGPAEDTADEDQLIREIHLIDPSNEEDPVIRTIRYEAYLPADNFGRAPASITFIDNTNGDTGKVRLKEYRYNVGLPDFLFAAPELTETDL